MTRLSIGTNKPQHIYDLHASDFGLTGKKNLQQLQVLRDTLEANLSAGDTRLLKGHYRGEEAYLYYDLRTQNGVVTDLGNNVRAGVKASPAQAQYVITTATLN